MYTKRHHSRRTSTYVPKPASHLIEFCAQDKEPTLLVHPNNDCAVGDLAKHLGPPFRKGHVVLND